MMLRRPAAGSRFAALCRVVVFLAAAGCRSSPPTETVADLLEAFRLTTTQEVTREIDFGTPAARPLLGEGWAESGRRQRGTYLWGLGDRSSLRVFIPESRRVGLRFRCWPNWRTRDSQGLTVTVNDLALEPLTLSSLAAEYHLDVPAEYVIGGWNDLMFEYTPPGPRSDRPSNRKGVVAWDWLFIDYPDFPSAQPFVQSDPVPPGLVLPFGVRLDYFLSLAPDSHLTVDGLLPWGGTESAYPGSILQVELQTASSAEVQRFTLAPTNVQSSLPIPSSSPPVTRISFQALRGDAPSTGNDGLKLLRPVVRSATGAKPPRPQRSRKAEESRTNVLIYLVDTLRADHLGCYGYDKPTSPNIDRFAEDATLFTNVIAQSSWTRPAVASLFTGLYARTHGVNKRKSKVPVSLGNRMLQAILHRSGHETAAFITNGNVGQGFGFDVGFDVFERLPEQETEEVHRYSDAVNEAVFPWLDARSSDSPFYLYVHTTDPHSPYVPRSPYREQFAASVPPELGFQKKRQAFKAGRVRNQETYRDDLIALYDAEIAFNDHHFGALLDKLKALGAYDSTLIVFVADHGEEFLEHRGWGHGETLSTEQLSVPLIIKFPRGLAKGRRVDDVARQIDVMPTILDYLGQQMPPGTQGRSLIPCVGEGDDCDKPSETFAYLWLDGRHLDSVTDEGHKLIQNIVGGRSPARFELYDLHTDPREEKDLTDQRPVIAGYLRTKLRDGEKRPSAPPAEEATIDPVTEERLRALGY